MPCFCCPILADTGHDVLGLLGHVGSCSAGLEQHAWLLLFQAALRAHRCTLDAKHSIPNFNMSFSLVATQDNLQGLAAPPPLHAPVQLAKLQTSPQNRSTEACCFWLLPQKKDSLLHSLFLWPLKTTMPAHNFKDITIISLQLLESQKTAGPKEYVEVRNQPRKLQNSCTTQTQVPKTYKESLGTFRRTPCALACSTAETKR